MSQGVRLDVEAREVITEASPKEFERPSGEMRSSYRMLY